MHFYNSVYLKAKYTYFLDDQSFHLTCAGHSPINASKLKLNKFLKKITTTWYRWGHVPTFANAGRITKVSVTITTRS